MATAVDADAEYSASIRVSAPLVSKIEAQSHDTPEEAEVQRLVYANRKEKDDGLKEELGKVKANIVQIHVLYMPIMDQMSIPMPMVSYVTGGQRTVIQNIETSETWRGRVRIVR